MDKNLFLKKRITIYDDEYIKYIFNNNLNKINESIDVSTIDQWINLYPESLKQTHAHNFYEIIWFIEGTGLHEINFKNYNVNPGTMFFISPNQLHCTKNLVDHKGYVISFSDDFLFGEYDTTMHLLKYDIFHNYQNPFCNISKAANAKLFKIIEEIIEEYNQCECLYAHITILRYLLKLLLINIRRYGKWVIINNSSLSPSFEQKLFFDFCDLVENHFRTIHTVKKYANKLNVSTKVLTSISKQYGCITPKQLIHQRIILESKRMLAHAPMNLKQISNNLGFIDSSYFIKYFKRETGVSPTEYKNDYDSSHT